MRKNNTMRLANAFALAMAVLWVLCSAFIWLMPDLYWQLVTLMMHGRNASASYGSLVFGNFVLGGIVAVISAWITGLVLGWSWQVVGGNNKR